MNVVKEPLLVSNIMIQLKTNKPVKGVYFLTNGQFLARNAISLGLVEMALPVLNAFEIVLVEYQDG